VEPDAIAQARHNTPAGDFRLGMMEGLPWPENTFDVVTAFNAVQYCLDPELALMEAGRVLRSSGRIAICKWGPAADNEFFAFLASLRANGVRADGLHLADPVDEAIAVSDLEVVLTGDVAAPIEMADDAALKGSLARAGIVADPVGAPAQVNIVAAGEPYRRAGGAYRFDNRLRYWILRP
jgi:SAM-dependent methyltransferase